MKPTIIIAAAIALLATPALANDYDVSPATGAIYPSSTPYSPPTIVVVPVERPFPRTCPIDGPGAWTCDRRERHRPRPGPFDR